MLFLMIFSRDHAKREPLALIFIPEDHECIECSDVLANEENLRIHIENIHRKMFGDSIEEEEWIKSKIDINFLEALSWSPLFVEE